MLAGFPISQKFQTPEQLSSYFGGTKIQCLRCGKLFRTLGVHLKTMHEMEPDEYRDIYDIPWTYGLSCEGTTALHAADAKEKHADGRFNATAQQAAGARALPRRRRVCVRDVLTARNLAKLNAGKTGEVTQWRAASTSPKGSEEFKRKMRERPQTKAFDPANRRGKAQSSEHIAKRVAARTLNVGRP